MEHIYREGKRQGSMGRAHGRLCQPIHDITALLRMWRGGQERPLRKVAFVRVWHRTGQGHQLGKAYPQPGVQSTFGRDAANAGNGVEASGLGPEVRSRLASSATA